MPLLGQKWQIWQNLEYLGAHIPTSPSLITGKFDMWEQTAPPYPLQDYNALYKCCIIIIIINLRCAFHITVHLDRCITSRCGAKNLKLHFRFSGSYIHPLTNWGEIWHMIVNIWYAFHAKFHNNWWMVTPLQGKILQIWQIEIWQDPVITPRWWGPNLTRDWTRGVLFNAKFNLDWGITSHLRGKKHQIIPYFQIYHCVVAPPSGAETKLNAHAQLQTSPVQRYQNRF